MNATDNVCTIIHSDLRQGIDDGIDMFVVGLSVFALDGINRDFEMLHQRCRGIILGRKRVGCAECHFGAARFQGAHQVGSFSGNVQAGTNADSLQGFFFFETFADRSKYWHVAICPKNAV